METRRGKGTKLSEFGEKLVWAGQRTQARLGPQLENLAQELATEIKPFLRTGPAVIRVHASHGFAVPKLRELLDQTPGIAIDLRYVSNQNSLASLAQGACDLSGVHLPRGELRQQNIEACRKWLDPREHRVISFVTREMGLIVKRGNPLGIASVGDIADKHARFVNRDHDSGTRVLFDQRLALNKVDESEINGLEQIEFTHAAVAAYVASDMADVSFGVEAAARQLSRFHPPPDRGLFLRLPPCVSRHRTDAAPARRREGPCLSRGGRVAAGISGDEYRGGQHHQGIPRQRRGTAQAQRLTTISLSGTRPADVATSPTKQAASDAVRHSLIRPHAHKVALRALRNTARTAFSSAIPNQKSGR